MLGKFRLTLVICWILIKCLSLKLLVAEIVDQTEFEMFDECFRNGRYFDCATLIIYLQSI